MISLTLFSVLTKQSSIIVTLIPIVIAVLSWVYPFPAIGNHKQESGDEDEERQSKQHKQNSLLIIRIVVSVICLAVSCMLVYKSYTVSEESVNNMPPSQKAETKSDSEVTSTAKLESSEWKEVEESSPGPSDMAGYSEIQAPQSTSWLDAREKRYVYAPHGAAVYIYKGPSLGYEKVNGKYGVADGTEITLLALENGMYLVKTGNGLLGWINTSGTIETRLIDSMPQLTGSYWIYSKGTGDAYTFACKFDSSLKLVGFRLSDGKKVTWTCRSAGRVLVFDEMKFIWDGEQFAYETQAYLWVDPDQTFDKYS